MKYRKLKRFLSYYKPYLRLFAADMVCALGAAAISLVYPLIVRYITNTILTNYEISEAVVIIAKLALVMAGLAALELFCNYFISYQGHIMGAKMEYDMRNDIFNHFQKLSFNFYDNQKTGQLMSRITNDLFEVTELSHHGPEDIVISIIKFVGAFVILIRINVPLTLLLFLFLPVMFLFAWKMKDRMNKAFKANRQRIADINAGIEDNLSGIRVVKSFANEDIEVEKFKEGNGRFVASKKLAYKEMATFHSGLGLFTSLINIGVIVGGSLMIAGEFIKLSDLLTFLLYVNNVVEPVRKLINFTEQFQNGATGFERFMEIMDTEPDIQDAKDAVELKAVRGDITFENVAFRYEDTLSDVFRNITLDVKAGDYMALVGSSGVGKTTLCSLIPRFYDVTEGVIKIDGQDVRKITMRSLRNSIGIVQQDVYLFAGTVTDNIRYGKPDATMEEIIEAAKNANAHDFIMELPDGYNTYIGQRGIKLSGGQKQRLSIARVFLKNPPILIFDEATSALDNESEKVVQDSLEKLAKNRTTFVIAHRLSTIKNAKNIIVLGEDGIKERGTHEELLAKNGVYAGLYTMTYTRTNMKLYDISQEVFGCTVFPGDPAPRREVLCSMDAGALYNLTSLHMCTHNGTHVDAPYHFIDAGKTTEQIPLEAFVGPCFVVKHQGVVTAEDAENILRRAAKSVAEGARRILIKGVAEISLEAAEVFAEAGVLLVGNESQTVGPENAPMAVHKVLLGAEVVLLEGIRLSEVPEGVYLLNAAPLNLAGADGAPCRAILLDGVL